MHSPYSFKRVLTTDEEYVEVFNLREELLRKPLGMSLHNEDLSDEVNDYILAGLHNERIISCLILTPKNDNILQLRQMAVELSMQGKDAGKQLVNFAEQYAIEQGYSKIVLHARVVAKGFYEKLVYQQTSDVFTEVGIPHVVMEKQLV